MPRPGRHLRRGRARLSPRVPPVPQIGRREARGSPPVRGRCSCAIKRPAGDEDAAASERRRRLDQCARVEASQVGDEPPGPGLTSWQPGPRTEPPIRPGGPGTRPSPRTRHRHGCLRCSGDACPHPHGGRDSCVAQDARVVVKHLDEDIAPEPAQPLAVLEHGESATGGLINRVKRLHLHVCNGSDRTPCQASGTAVPAHRQY
jgi:hypothetical protein